MIELFRKNLFVNLLLILPYLIMVRIGTLIFPEKSFYEYTGNNVFLQWFYGIFSTPLSQSLLAILLIFFHAVFINRISIKHRLSLEITLFPGIAYIILVSLVPGIAGLHPALLANSFMLIVVSNLFLTYNSPRPAVHNFNIGLFLGVAVILYPPFIFFLIFCLIGLMILSSFKWKQRTQFLTGFVVANYLYYSLVYCYTDSLQSNFRESFEWMGYFDLRLLSIFEIIVLLFYAILFFITFFSYNRYGIKKSIQVQKKIDTLFWFMLFAAVAAVFNNKLEVYALLTLALPISLLIGINMSNTKNKVMLEILHLMSLGIIILSFFFLRGL